MRNIVEYYKKIDKVSNTIPNKCKIGCSYCCNGPIVIPTFEIANIIKQINKETLMNLKEQLKQYIQELPQIDSDEYWNHNNKCIFLEIESRKCNIYRNRPAACRKYTSSNPENCIKDKISESYKDNRFKKLFDIFYKQVSLQNYPIQFEDMHIGIHNYNISLDPFYYFSNYKSILLWKQKE